MSMAGNLFETVKQSVTVREAAQMYGVEANRNGMACCPFHDDKHPSMKLNEEYFYCFGCGATGDVIDFTARLYNLAPREAAEKLAQDFGLAYDSQAPPRRRYIRQRTEAQKFREDRDHAFRVLADYYHLLRKWETDYSPKTPEENPHPRFMEAIQRKDYMGYLLDFFLGNSPEEQKLWIAGHQSEIANLERRVKIMADKPTNKERLKELGEKIEAGIREVFDSGKYAEYLKVMSRFPTYSVNNQMLIRLQRPNATKVAGYNKWQQFERHVKRGEHGITIIAPTPYKKKIEEQKLDPDTKAPVLDANGKVVMEEKEIEIPTFRPIKVFDYAQTEGKPLPQLAADLFGNVQHYEAFMEALRRTSPVPLTIEPMQDNMDGFFSPTTQRIAIRQGMSEVQTVCACIHEMTHATLHNYEKQRMEAAAGDPSKEPPKPKPHQIEEIEAESTSYMVCQYFGIETGENSFGYVASYCKDRELSELRACLNTINKTAGSMIAGIEKHFAEVCKEQGIDLSEQKKEPEQTPPAVEEPAAEESAAPELDPIDRLAADIDQFSFDYDTYEYRDRVDDREEALRELTTALHGGDSGGIRDWLREFADENEPGEANEKAMELLERLDQLVPMVEPEQLDEPEPEVSMQSPARHVYKVHSNFERTSPADSTYIQEYTVADDLSLIPGEVLYTGTHDECVKLNNALQDSSMTVEQVKAQAQMEKLYELDGQMYLHIQPCDGGYDYTIYNKDTMLAIDGGQLDAPELPLFTAALKICEMHDLGGQSIKYAPLAMIETLQEAAYQQMEEAAAQAAAPESTMLPDAPEQALDEYPMPDPMLTLDDLEKCGYRDGDMLPLSKERAMELYERDLTVYAVVDGGSAEMLFDREEFDTQAAGTMYAVSREEWEESPEFDARVQDRLNHQEERERAFLSHEGDCFAIYQVAENDPQRLRFMNMDWLNAHDLSVERGNYDLVYTAPLPETGSIDGRLHKLFEQFNFHRPADFHSPSMSVSDIVAIKRDGVVSCHYCDSVGFQEIPGFLPSNPLKNAEMTVEDDYGMIDGIINNGPKATVAELEAQARSGQPISLMDLADAVHREERDKKKSVMEQLRQSPKQERKKTAPKRSAEREL